MFVLLHVWELVVRAPDQLGPERTSGGGEGLPAAHPCRTGHNPQCSLSWFEGNGLKLTEGVSFVTVTASSALGLRDLPPS